MAPGRPALRQQEDVCGRSSLMARSSTFGERIDEFVPQRRKRSRAAAEAFPGPFQHSDVVEGRKSLAKNRLRPVAEHGLQHRAPSLEICWRDQAERTGSSSPAKSSARVEPQLNRPSASKHASGGYGFALQQRLPGQQGSIQSADGELFQSSPISSGDNV